MCHESNKWNAVVRFHFEDTILADEGRREVIQEPLVAEYHRLLRSVGKADKVEPSKPPNGLAILSELKHDVGKGQCDLLAPESCRAGPLSPHTPQTDIDPDRPFTTMRRLAARRAGGSPQAAARARDRYNRFAGSRQIETTRQTR